MILIFLFLFTACNNSSNSFTCDSCGKKIEESVKFCPYCGDKIEDDVDNNNTSNNNTGNNNTENNGENSLLYAPSEYYVISCLEKVPGILEIAAVTEDNDPNGNLNKQGGYISQVFFSYSLVDQAEVIGDNLIDKGTDAGGSIEVYTTVEYANRRNEYLSSFDGSGFLTSGSHIVIGTTVVRTSDELTASQQKLLESNIIFALKGEVSKIVSPNENNETSSGTGAAPTPHVHIEVIDSAVAPTCTTPGITTGKRCSLCNEVLVEQTVVDALGHTEVVDEALDPTCNETGLTEGKHCSVCGEVFIRQTTLPALEHNFVYGTCNICSETVYTREGDYIYFGEYPQTIIAEGVTITSTTDDRGYYLGSDGYYYATVTATPKASDYTFTTGDAVTSGTVYHFKVEPIRWRILSEDGKTAFILCDSIVANQRYDDDSNNYAESEIRKWLNATFYKTAFNELQKEIILTTTVDNSVSSTIASANQYTCENTEDNIFLLSYAEVTNNEYGFLSIGSNDDTARVMQTSDYSRATGAYTSTSIYSYGNGRWWLRSPHYLDSQYVYGVYYDGSFSGLPGLVYHSSDYGIVPAMWISL